MTRQLESLRGRTFLPWTPLLVAALSSYGPVSFNYGFALYFLDYRHGFVKRGLLGQMFSHIAFFTRSDLLLAEYLFLAVAYGLCCYVFRRALLHDRSLSMVAVLLLSAPGTLPHMGYLFAQPDVTLFLLLLFCLWLFLDAAPTVAAVASLPLCWLALLGHEAFSLMFYPLVLAILLQLCRTRRLRWTLGVAHLALVFLALVAVVHFGTLKVPPDTLLAEAQARTGVGIQRQVYDVMASSLTQQQALVHRMYTPLVWKWFFLTLTIAAPYFALLVSLLHRTMRAVAIPLWQSACTCLLFLSPLLLCFLGHDFTRWMGAACIDASFFILYLALTEERAAETLRAWAAASGRGLAWLGYLVAAGPMGATGIRSAEQLLAALARH